MARCASSSAARRAIGSSTPPVSPWAAVFDVVAVRPSKFPRSRPATPRWFVARRAARRGRKAPRLAVIAGRTSRFTNRIWRRSARRVLRASVTPPGFVIIAARRLPPKRSRPTRPTASARLAATVGASTAALWGLRDRRSWSARSVRDCGWGPRSSELSRIVCARSRRPPPIQPRSGRRSRLELPHLEAPDRSTGPARRAASG